MTRATIVDAANVTRTRTARVVRHRRAAHRALRAESARRRRRAVRREDDEILRPRPPRPGIAGPFPADTVFVRAMRGAFDAVIAPYHDVGMTAIKVASFGSAVNVTLGLAVSALLAGSRHRARHRRERGVADPSSMIESILLCADIARRMARRTRARRRLHETQADRRGEPFAPRVRALTGGRT